MIVNPVVQGGGDIEYEIINGPAKGFPASAKAGDFVMSQKALVDWALSSHRTEMRFRMAWHIVLPSARFTPYFVMPAQSVTIS